MKYLNSLYLRQTDRRIVQNHFSRRFGDSITKIRSYLEVDFLHDANTMEVIGIIDMEVKRNKMAKYRKLERSFVASDGFATALDSLFTESKHTGV